VVAVRARTALGAAALVAVALLGWPGAAGAQEEGGEPEITHESEECIEILEGGGDVDECQEAPSPILPEANELIWGIISFVVLLGLLWRFAWPGLRRSMDARAERIRSSLDEAEGAKAEASSVLEDYRRQLADARGEASRIIEEARQSADALKRDLQARAEREAEEQRRRNAEQIAAERDRVMSELQSQVATLAVDLAEKVVETNLDREANLRLIENYINSVGADEARR
jgi:F-type H+-transporting ATPase subunit b